MRTGVGKVGARVLASGFALALAAGAAAAGENSVERAPTLVVTAEAEARHFEDSHRVDGVVAARFFAVVSARVGGIIDEVAVREGDTVTQNETVLFSIDNIKLRHALEISKQALNIARSSLEEKKAQLLKTRADLDQARKDFARSEKLFRENAITEVKMEQDQTAMSVLEAQEKIDDALVRLQEETVKQAETQVEMSTKDYTDSTMKAPLTGIVSKRYAEPGEMAAMGTPILRLEDTVRLKAVGYLPGQYYPRVKVGETQIVLTVLDREIGRYPITYKAPSIDAAYRTFEVWANVPGDGAFSVPGAQARLTTVFDARDGVGVPANAAQLRGGKWYVFVPEGNRARRVEVTKGLETRDPDGTVWVELVDAPFAAGQKVVVQGQFMLEDGYPVREREERGAN